MKKNYVERKHSIWVWKNEDTFTKQVRKVVAGRRDSPCQVSKTLRTRKSETKSRCSIDILQKTGVGEKGVPVDPPHEGFMAGIIHPIVHKWKLSRGVKYLAQGHRVAKPLGPPKTQPRSVMLLYLQMYRDYPSQGVTEWSKPQAGLN